MEALAGRWFARRPSDPGVTDRAPGVCVDRGCGGAVDVYGSPRPHPDLPGRRGATLAFPRESPPTEFVFEQPPDLSRFRPGTCGGSGAPPRAGEASWTPPVVRD